MQEVLHDKCYNIHKTEKYFKHYNIHKTEKYFVQTRSQIKTNGTVFPKVHSIDKGLDPNLRSEIQGIKPSSTPVQSYVPTE